jgi:GT2 family glycosyltransferase
MLAINLHNIVNKILNVVNPINPLQTVTGGVRTLFEMGPSAFIGKVKKVLYRENNSCDIDLEYSAWIKKYDLLAPKKELTFLKKISLLSHQPKISIMLPIHKPNLSLLKQAIDSIISQIYSNWELYIFVDNRDDYPLNNYLNGIDESHKNVTIKSIHKWDNVLSSLNKAVDATDGLFTILFNQCDLLRSHSLFEVAECYNHNLNANIIYSDEDKIDHDLQRHSPYFKTDWNQLLFYGNNYINQLCAIRSDLIKTAGGFKKEFEDCFLYDLLLRVVEKIEPYSICHIPKILYHSRVNNDFPIFPEQINGNGTQSGRNALEEHLSRQGVKYNGVSITRDGYYRVGQEPQNEHLVSIIIPTKNNYNYLIECLRSIVNNTLYKHYKIVIVDNGSTEDNTLYLLESLSNSDRISVINSLTPFNFSYLINLAVMACESEYLCFLNDDTSVVSPNWLGELLGILEDPKVGVVGCKLLYHDNTIQHAGVVLGLGGVAGHIYRGDENHTQKYFNLAQLVQGVSAITAACMLTKKSIFTAVNGFDEKNLKVAFNDVDYCLKVRERQYDVVYTPYACLHHYEGASRPSDLSFSQILRFRKEYKYMQSKWEKALQNDPFFNKNLSLKSEAYNLSFPPR